MRWLLRKLGYLKVECYYTCGRHVLEIDGKTVAQADRSDVWLDDESVLAIGKALGEWPDWPFYGWRAPPQKHDEAESHT